MPKSRFFKALFLCIAAIVVVDIIMGIHIAINGLTVAKFSSVSPASALFSLQSFGLFFRFVDSMMLLSARWFFSSVVFILPLALIIGSAVYFIKKREADSKKKIALKIVSASAVVFVANFIGLLFIPGPLEWLIFNIKAQQDSKKGSALLESREIITSVDTIRQKIPTLPSLHVYADYGNGGLILKALLDQNTEKKYTYYESFYMPIFFNRNKDKVWQGIESSEVALMDNSLVFGTDVSQETLQQLLPLIGDRFIKTTYSGVRNGLADIKTFKVIPDADFRVFYTKKSIENLRYDLEQNQQAFKYNLAVINEYPSLIKRLDEEYKKYVIDLEETYQSGCVQVVRYTDCARTRSVIDQNKITLETDRKTALENYNLARKYNPEIELYIQKGLMAIDEFESDSKDSLENNKGELSVGVTFNNDTIYIRYYEENPISGDNMRVIVHEMLHAYSYNRETRLPQSINEGFTDYFATKALGYNELDSVRAAGYPLETQVALALMEKIPAEKLQRIYFNQDEEALKQAIKTYFPEVNYTEFVEATEALFKGTYNAGGTVYNFNKELIDHSEVRKIRALLGLPEFKYNNIIY